jgi:hypothetical protein
MLEKTAFKELNKKGIFNEISKRITQTIYK